MVYIVLGICCLIGSSLDFNGTSEEDTALSPLLKSTGIPFPVPGVACCRVSHGLWTMKGDLNVATRACEYIATFLFFGGGGLQ